MEIRMEIRTDEDLVKWLRLLPPAGIEAFIDMCDRKVAEGGDTTYAVYAGTARAMRRGEDPVAFQRAAAGLFPGYYA
jgi:hypothetical protein